jgi:TolA-binding protein
MSWKSPEKSTLRNARGSRAPGRGPRRPGFALLLFLVAICFVACKEKTASLPATTGDARTLFTNTMTRFHAPAADAKGAERDRLLAEATKGYGELLKKFPAETNLCAQSLRALGSIHATQGKTNEAVKFYAAVGEKYPSQDWEVLQAWKSAADLLWESNQRDEARKFYAKIVERFGKNDMPQIISRVARGSKARLAE